MPNIVTSLISMAGNKEQIKKVLDIFKQNNTHPFEKIIPTPKDPVAQSNEELAFVSRIERLYHRPGTFNGVDISDEQYEAEEARIATLDIPDIEKAALEYDLLLMHWNKSTNLLGWHCSHWGTRFRMWEKQISDKYSLIRFQTAWSSCPQIIRALSHQYPDVTFTLAWADEAGQGNDGILIYENGKKEGEVYLGSSSRFEDHFVRFIEDLDIEKKYEWDSEEEQEE